MSSISTANQVAVSELYIALLGRNPEQGGYAFWVNKLNAGQTQSQAAAQMCYEPEFFDTYAALGTTEAIARIYVNVFERTADAGGLQYWSDRAQALIDAGTPVVVAYGQIATTMIDTGYTNGSSDTPLIQARVDAATAAGTAQPSVTHTLTTSQFVYGGTQANDIYNAPLETLGNAAVNTLQSFTSIDGAGGVNTLNAVLASSVTPLALTKIQIVNANVNSASVSATLNLLNAPDVTAVNSVGTIGELIVTNIASGASISTTDVAVASVFSYVAGNTTAADLTVTGATTASTNITVDNSSGTVNLTSAGTSANSIELLGAAAITTVNVDGTAALTLDSVDASLVDASLLTGALTAVMEVAAGTLIGGSGNDTLTSSVASTVNGNAGNDTIDVDGAAAVVSVNGGTQNDTLLFGTRVVANTATAADNDTIDGGLGVDTLSAASAQLAAIDNTAANAIQSIFNIETLTVSDALSDSLTLSKIQAGLSTVNLALGVDASGPYTITFDSAVANATLNLAGDLDTVEVLGVTAAGTATTDALAIVNTTSVANDAFNGGLITATGYESLTLNGGLLETAQTLDNLTVNDSGAEAVTITVAGANAFTLADFDTNNTGVQTINASGLTLATDTVFTYTDGTFGTGATQSITGSEGNDSIIANNGNAATITGGAGIDTLTGGAAADSVQGGLGNDVIDGAAGNDVLKGNEGDDSITIGAGSDTVDGGAGNDTIIAAANLTAADSIDGGAGVNTLSITAAVTSPSIGGRVSNVSILNTAATTQDLSMFTATTLTTVVEADSADDALALTNAASTLTTLTILEANAFVSSIQRDVDTLTNALTVNAGVAIAALSALTASNEETITLAGSTFAVDLVLATATDLASLIITGSGDQTIDASSATVLSSINIAGVTGTATAAIDASGSTVALTFTGAASTGTQSITSGSGADVITAGSGIIVAVTGIGADTVTGSGLADTITGGAGADSLTGGAGADTFVVGATLTDWAVGDYVAGGTDAATTDILSFGDDGLITYVDRTVSSIESLVLTLGASNEIIVTQGTGLVSVDNLEFTGANTLTIMQSTSVFGAQSANAASVTAAGNWFLDTATSGADDTVTYWDQVTGAAVSITLVGVDTAGSTAAAVVGGNLVATVTV